MSGKPSPSGTATITDPCTAEDAAARIAARRIGRYQLGEVLGTGGMGTVFRAHDPDLKRELAIKVVPPGPRDPSQHRVLREAEALAKLRHANVVAIFDVGVDGSDVYLVMPWLEGGTLRTWLAAGPRPWRAIASHFLAAARGLAAAHSLGLVHRDFKPDNVLLGARGEVQVADFGLVRVEPDASPTAVPAPDLLITHAGAVLGTPAYMAPEQLDGATVDARADQFSFSVAFYEALFGQRPFVSPGRAPTAQAILRDRIRTGTLQPPAPGRRAPRWLRSLVLRGLREAPAARWPSMLALISALERGLRRRRWLISVGAAVLIAVAAAAVARMGSKSELTVGPTDSWGERPISRRGDIHSAALSPDGAYVAAMAGDTLALFPTDGGEPQTLLHGFDVNTAVSWSSDGRRLLLGQGVEHSSYDIIDETSVDVPEIKGRHDQLLADGSILRFVGPMQFETVHPIGSTISCLIPSESLRVERAEILGATLFLTLVNGDLSLSLVAMPPTCGPSRLLLDHLTAQMLVARDDGHVFASARGASGLELQGYTERGVAVGARSTIQADEVVGIRTGIGIVFTRAERSTRMFDVESSSRNYDRGSVGPVIMAPDGRRFAVVDARPVPGALRISALERLKRPTPPVAIGVRAVAWSPDAQRLAATSLSETDRSDLMVIDARTGHVRRIQVAGVSSFDELVWLDENRIAFRRTDNRIYHWLSLRDATTGVVTDSSRGWTHALAVSRYDGTVALAWHRIEHGRADTIGTWLIRPDGSQLRVREQLDIGRGLDGHAWSVDGKTLWMYQHANGAIDRYDLETGQTTHVRSVHLDANETIVAIYPMADGRVLLRTMVQNTDLFVYGPKP